MEWMAYQFYFPFIKLVYKPKYDPIKLEDLFNCPFNSLGYESFMFLKKRNIELFHGYEVHDLKHVLLNIDMTIKGEIMLEYFELGNGNKSLVVWIVILGGTLIMPEYFKTYFKYYKLGKNTKKLQELELQTLINEPINQLRQSINYSI